MIYDRYVPDETFLLSDWGCMAKSEVMKKRDHQVLDELASPVNPEYWADLKRGRNVCDHIFAHVRRGAVHVSIPSAFASTAAAVGLEEAYIGSSTLILTTILTRQLHSSRMWL